MIDPDGHPYNLPFNFGCDEEFVYLHSGPEGKKIRILQLNPEVCLAFSNSEELAYQSADVACSHFMRYKSALVWGPVEFMEDPAEKEKALSVIMKQYTGRDDYQYGAPAIKNVKVFRVSTKNMSGKIFGY